MIENPHTIAAEDARRERSEREAFHYPFCVCAIFYNQTAAEQDMIITIKKWCQENKVPFKAREYDAVRYDEDCHYVARFPAYHIYWNRHHYKTYHWDDKPVHGIMATILEWKAEQEKKRQREEKMRALAVQVRGWFSLSKFKRKPRLEVTLVPKAVAPKAQVPIEFEAGAAPK